jgi:hypothetical protein
MLSFKTGPSRAPSALYHSLRSKLWSSPVSVAGLKLIGSYGGIIYVLSDLDSVLSFQYNLNIKHVCSYRANILIFSFSFLF